MDWEKHIPPIVGNRTIIEKKETPEEVLFEKSPKNNQISATKSTEKGTKSSIKGQVIEGLFSRKRLKRVSSRSKLIKFTANDYVQNVIKEVESKYGRRGLTAFINTGIEQYYKKSQK
jgi:hypothetical protein